MKKLKHLWILILLFGLVSMAACGKPEEELPENKIALVDCQETITAHQNLLLKHINLEAECKRLKERDAEYVAAIKTLSDENLALRTAMALNQVLDTTRQEELESALNELITLRKEKKDWSWLAKQEYEQLLKNQKSLIEAAKAQERERIIKILKKAYPASDNWSCWEAIKGGK